MEETEYATKEDIKYLRQLLAESIGATINLGKALLVQIDVLTEKLAELEGRVDKLS